MDLVELGKIAGLGGLAIGMIVLVMRHLLARVPSLPPKDRGPTLQLIAIGAFVVGGLGVMAWLLAGSAGVHVTGAAGGITAGGNVSNSPVTNTGGQAGPADAAPKP